MIILQSTIIYPECGHKKEETMPTDLCQYFYECKNCSKIEDFTNIFLYHCHNLKHKDMDMIRNYEVVE